MVFGMNGKKFAGITIGLAVGIGVFYVIYRALNKREKEQICSSDADCPKGQVCIDGICRPMTKGKCESDSDCKYGYRCVNGICVPILPDKPYLYKAEGDVLNKTIRLEWSPPKQPATYPPIIAYRIYRATYFTGRELSYSKIAEVDGNTLNYTNINVPKRRFSYRITAVNMNGESEPSNEMDAGIIE